MTGANEPRILPGCTVLPPMEPRRTGSPTPHTGNGSKPKGKANRRQTADRFAVLNAFVDFTAGELTRSELLVWLVLYRDTRDGTARTAQADAARRTGLGRRTVGLALARLERRGLVKTVYRGGLNRGPSRYRVFPLDRGQTQPRAPAQ